ncbi:MAG: NAD(P)H-dependent oxidoreductase subunit E [Candidatus Wallbacteria bacterium]|nr:NAD(P)H-dependent oxidoreductase subunit E [Candidatus Wallbacteria bacterium]
MNTAEIQGIVAKHQGHPGEVLSILEDLQSRFSYLPEEALRFVAEKTGRPLRDLYGVATFYKMFSFRPRGKHLVSVCLGTACHVRRATLVAEEFEQKLAVKPGETTPDKQITLETVNCVGACALGPIVVVDGHYFPNVKRTTVQKILERTRNEGPRDDPNKDPRIFPVEVRCPRCNHTLMDPENPLEGHPSVRVTISFGANHGCLRLSSLYGSFTIACDFETPPDAVVHFFCPYCHAELLGATSCMECAAPMVPMVIEGGGIVQICSRYGCKGHLLDL